MTIQILFSLSSWNLCCGIWGQSNVIRNQTRARAKTVAKVSVNLTNCFFVIQFLLCLFWAVQNNFLFKIS